jgi:hypothetical protein
MKLKAMIETGKPTIGTRVLFGLFKLLPPLSPKVCSSEFWPVDQMMKLRLRFEWTLI